MEKFGFISKNKYDGFEYPQKVSRPRFEGINGDCPGPGQYDSNFNTKIKGGAKYYVEKKEEQNSFQK